MPVTTPRTGSRSKRRQPRGQPIPRRRRQPRTPPSEISGLVVLKVTVGYVDVITSRWSSRYTCIAGVIQLRLLLRTPAADLVDRQAGGAVRHTPRERLPGRRPPPPPSSACLRRRSRSPPGPELSDLVTSGLPREESGQGRASSRGRFCRVSEALGDKAEVVLIRLFAAQAFKVPDSTIHVARGATRTAKVWRWCCPGRGDGGEHGWGAELVAVAVPLRAQHAGCTAYAWTSSSRAGPRR